MAPHDGTKVWDRSTLTRGGRRIGAVIALLIAALLVSAHYPWPVVQDFLFWPDSAQRRIENRASIIRRIQAPARWCFPSTHAGNLLNRDLSFKEKVNRCIGKIEPVSDFVENEPGKYLKRFYRAEIDGYVCEATLSAIRGDKRFAGFDCYYGLFESEKVPPIGATDDAFG